MDPLNPDHYKNLDPEPIDVILNWKLDYLLGNVIKYIARYDKKGDPITDLKKAKLYLGWKIAQLEADQSKEEKALREKNRRTDAGEDC